MKNRYFKDTDTLLIELRGASIADSRDVDAEMVFDFDAAGSICSITIDHASRRADSPNFSYEQIAT